jgi:FAD/FMN-containing dehydrogenase
VSAPAAGARGFNLIEADVVLADGSFVTASETSHSDLFWALRGGGGNFGVVTSFVYRAHPVGTVHAGPMFWRREDAAEVMRWYRDFLPTAPEDFSPFLGLKTVPSTDPFPPELWGTRICALICCYDGPADEAKDAMAPPRTELPPPILDGAVQVVAPDATAWHHRDATWSMVIAGIDPAPSKAAALTGWARSYWEAVHPYTMGGAYVNFMMEEGDDRIRATYGDNYARLAEVKAAYDPTNLFRVNQNIQAEGTS